MAAKIKDVVVGGIAEEMDLAPGDQLIEINGHPILDILDYQFYSQEENLTLEIKKEDGEEWILEIDRDYDEDLGLIFDGVVFDRMKVCQNRCVFCFVDQLPQGMRETLYTKDDDYRYSFLYGNFITLTNMKEKDWEKILALRLSPLYVSVHCLRPDLRAVMLGSKKGGLIKDQLQRLKEAGIEVHTQIVLCPGYNDGEILAETIEGLAAFYPSLRSVGIVPVGLSAHRQELPQISPISPEEAEEVIDSIQVYHDRFRREWGRGFVYLADEFFIKTERDIPGTDYYDDFCQIENGIGLARVLLDEFAELEPSLPDEISKREVYIITGEAAFHVLDPLVKRLNRIHGLRVNLLPVANRFFGGGVTVTGLITGHDIMQVLKREYIGKRVIVPGVVLKEGVHIFLDDMSLEQLEKESGASISIVDGSARELVQEVLGGAE
ncbi:MAG TPA: DUF512 domain-containing protein [Syntrophomonadaceae bacterium]|nr:DUF512 domain-containing protein [Syntrophomonadaceae bacterium]